MTTNKGANAMASPARALSPKSEFKPAAKDPLVGKYFLTFTPKGEMQKQGKILSKTDGVYLCQLFEWMEGYPTEQRLFVLSEMKHWKFYDTLDMWHEDAERFKYRTNC
jgi:hypothetical protein